MELCGHPPPTTPHFPLRNLSRIIAIGLSLLGLTGMLTSARAQPSNVIERIEETIERWRAARIATGTNSDSSSSGSYSRFSMTAGSLLNGSYAYANPVYFTNFVVSSGGSHPMTAVFAIGGGTNFVPYDI